MSERLKTLRRIHKVQSQIKRIAELRVADAERRKQDATEALNDLGAFLEGTIPVGPLARLASKQSERLVKRERAAEAARNDHQADLIKAQSRLTIMERGLVEAQQQARQAQERKDLQSLLDAFLARPPQDP